MTTKDEEAGLSTNGHSANVPSISLSPQQPPKVEFHPAFYVGIWIFFSGSVILFNKWVLDTAGFRFPIFLTTWHLLFATIATQVLARTTTLLDGLKTVKMDGRTYLRAIVPIGAFFSLSLICSNQAYLYLSVAFIQMLKATTPVAVLLTTWTMRIEPPNYKVLGNVSVIVLGVIVASYGEIAFVFIGFVFQACMIVFESIRLVMVQKLLSSPEYKMDPLVSLYYFAPVCCAMNMICCIIFEGPRLSVQAVTDAGLVMLFMNAAVAFCLNVAVVFLIGKTSSLVLTLSGVLKDILLVVLSVIIWSTPVTALQMFGYTIALGGLIYYKLGGEQAQAAYMKLAGDENSTFNRFRRSLWAKVGAGVLVVFVVLAMAHGFSQGQGIDTAASSTGLTGVPEPEMVDSYNPITPNPITPLDDTPGATVGGGWDHVHPPTHYTTDVIDDHDGNRYALDMVVFVSPSSANTTLFAFQELLELPAVARHQPRVISYGDVHSMIPGAQQIHSTRVTSASAAYMDYISNHYETLASHTLFLHTDVDVIHLQTSIASKFTARTGVAELSQGGYSVCSCLECVDSTHAHLTKTQELFALTNQHICTASDRLLLTDDALFIASAERILRNPKAVYAHLLDGLEGHDRELEQTVDKSWLYMLGCNDITMSTRCRGAETSSAECQCTD